MRIVAGRFGGRRLTTPGRGARPTTDRVREAWFSILSSEIPGAKVGDFFAGSGALGLEALSRGAAHADFFETDNAAVRALVENIDLLGVGKEANVRRENALTAASSLAEATYDIAFADPPYRRNTAQRLVEVFRKTRFARILSVEHEAGMFLDADDVRRYGDTEISFFVSDR